MFIQYQTILSASINNQQYNINIIIITTKKK